VALQKPRRGARLPPDFEDTRDDSTLERLVTGVDAILAEIGGLDNAVEEAAGMDPADRRELKRRLDALWRQASELFDWICDQREFDSKHN
jgi:hypothetical protein